MFGMEDTIVGDLEELNQQSQKQSQLANVRRISEKRMDGCGYKRVNSQPVR